MSVVPPDLKALAPNTMTSQLFCEDVKCTAAYTRCPTVGEDDAEYSWCVKFRCTHCNSVWWLCRSCQMRKKIIRRSNLVRHHYGNHGTTLAESKKRGKVTRNSTNSKMNKTTHDDVNEVTTKQLIIPPFEKDEKSCEHGSVYDVERSDVDFNSTTDSKPASSNRYYLRSPSKSMPPPESPSITPHPSPSFRMRSSPNKHTSRVITSTNNDVIMSPLKSPITLARSDNIIDNNKMTIVDIKDIKTDKVKTNVLDLMLRNNQIHSINDNMNKFYSHDLISSGKKYLITKMCNTEDRNANDVFRNISNEEVECQIRISDFVRTLTRNQKKDFAGVVNDITKSYIQQQSKSLCILPGSYADIRRLYVDGIDSVTKNLPIPNITRLVSHSYVSITDCIADFLLSNHRQLKFLEEYEQVINHSDKNLTLFSTDRAKEIIDEGTVRRFNKQNIDSNNKILVLFLKLWSDDFDPNSSIKSNRMSVWVKTATIFAMTSDGTKLSYTYPLATSPKNVDHEEVEFRLCQELKLLRFGKMKSFYCRFLSAPVMVHADIFCVMTDQPERRSALGLAAGNSRRHKRFGYLFDCVNSIDVVRACTNCQNTIIDKSKYAPSSTIGVAIWNIKPCNECTCWLLFPNSPLLSYTPDKLYPESKLEMNGKLMPKKITKHDLQSTVDDVTLVILRKIWPTTVCKAYLRNEGFNQKCIDEITDNAINSLALREAKKKEITEPERWRTICSDYTKDPKRYIQWSLPSSWYYATDTDLYVDVPMHLLLLGVAKSVYIKISKWLKVRMQSTEFKTLTIGVLEKINKYTLDWCKVLSYPNTSTDKFGGWVAENFLGFIRISPWFYSLLHRMKDAKEKPNLETPPTAWRVKENKFWLELRGLPTEGNAKVLKERVREYLEMNEQPPIIDNDNVGIIDIMNLVTSLHEMISFLLSMNQEYSVIDYIELIIRKFLIYYDKVDTGMGKNEQPSWMTQYNFLCLLNIPNVMRRFGFVRNIWEGGVEGEGFLRNYKKEMRNGLQPKWQIWTIRNLMQRSVFNKEHIETTTNWRERLANQCRIYQSNSIITKTINDNNPLSGIIDDDTNTVYILFRQKKETIGIQVEIDWDTYNTLHDKKYYEIQLIPDADIVINDAIGARSTSCLLLPQLIEQEEPTYCIVYSDWRIN